MILSGWSGIVDHIDWMIDLYDYDWDWWNEQIAKAFKRIGEPAIKRIFARYSILDWLGRLFMGGVLEDVQFKGAEQEIQNLLAME